MAPAGDADAEFIFETNIEDILGRISAGARRIEEVVNKQPASGQDFLREQSAAIDRMIEQKVRQVDAITNRFRAGKNAPGTTFSGEVTAAAGGMGNDLAKHMTAALRNAPAQLQDSDLKQWALLQNQRVFDAVKEAYQPARTWLREQNVSPDLIGGPHQMGDARKVVANHLANANFADVRRGVAEIDPELERLISSYQRRVAEQTQRAAHAAGDGADAAEADAVDAERSAREMKRIRAARELAFKVQTGAARRVAGDDSLIAEALPGGRTQYHDKDTARPLVGAANDRAAEAESGFAFDKAKLEADAQLKLRAAGDAEAGVRLRALTQMQTEALRMNAAWDDKVKSDQQAAAAARVEADIRKGDLVVVRGRSGHVMDPLSQEVFDRKTYEPAGKADTLRTQAAYEDEQADIARRTAGHMDRDFNKRQQFSDAEDAARKKQLQADEDAAGAARIEAGLREKSLAEVRGAPRQVINRETLEVQDKHTGRASSELDTARTQRLWDEQNGVKSRTFMQSFLHGATSSGFGGNGPDGLTGLGQAAGVSIKYAAIGTAIYGLQSAVRAAAQEYLDFVDSNTELSVAMGDVDNVSQGFINDLSEVAREAGTNVGEAMDVAASGIRAFGAGLSDIQKQNIGESFAQAAQVMAVLAKTDLTDAAGNIKAIANAFDVDPANFNQINDAIAGAKALGGGDEKQVAQGLASIGVAAKEAGFSLNETASIISKVQALTDESGSAVATRLSKVFAIVGGSQGKNAISQLNASLAPEQQIDTSPTATLKDQLDGLSQVYGTLTKAQQQQLVSALGGTANTRELITLLQNYTSVMDDAGKSTNFNGHAMSEYDRRLHDLTGTLRQITGDLKGLATQIGISGIFAPVGLALKALEPGLHLLNDILSTFNKIPGPVRDISIAILEIVAAMKVLQAVQREGGLMNMLKGAEKAAFPTRALARRELEGAVPAGAGAIALAEERGSVGMLQRTRGALQPGATLPLPKDVSEFKANLKSAGRSVADFGRSVKENGFRQALNDSRVGTAVNDWGAANAGSAGEAVGRSMNRIGDVLNSELGTLGTALAGFQLVSGFAHSGMSINAALQKSRDTMSTGVDYGSSDALKKSADDLRSSAAALHEASSGFFGTISNWARNNETGVAAADAEQMATSREDAATRIDKLNKDQARSSASEDIANTIDLTSADTLSESMQRLSDSGQNATVQFNALMRAIDSAGSSANGTARSIQPGQGGRYSIELGQRVYSQLHDQIDNLDLNGQSQGKYTAKKMTRWVNQWSPGGEILNNLFPDKGAENADKLRKVLADGGIQKAVEDVSNQAIDRGVDPLTKEGADTLKEIISVTLRPKLKGFPKAVQDALLDGAVKVVTEESNGYNVLKDPAASLESIQKLGPDWAQSDAARVGSIASENGYSGGLVEAQTFKQNLVDLRAAALKQGAGQSVLDGWDEKIRHADDAVKVQMAAHLAALREVTTSMIPSADAAGRIQSQIDGVDEQLSQTQDGDKILGLQAQKNALLQQAFEQATADADAVINLRGGVNDTVQQAQNAYDTAVNDLNKMEAGDPTKGIPGVTTGATHDAQVLKVRQAAYANKMAPVTMANAKRAAAVDPYSAVDQAASDLAGARATLHKMAKSDANYWTQLAQVHQLMKASAEAIAADARNQALLRIDMTDPVAMANLDLKIARDKLAKDLAAGKKPDVINADKVDVQTKQSAAEAAKFQQRFSDAQTADELGRISHAAYLRYLQNEHDRLTAIKVRTRQQQDELDQVDQALKSTTDNINQALSGQFNIGDIQVPTVYQVRRALTAGDNGNIYGANVDVPMGARQSVANTAGTAAIATYNTTTNNVTLNGLPLDQVLAYITKIMNAGAAGVRQSTRRGS